MKYLRIYESFQSEAKIKEICKKYGIENYTVNSDGLIDVNGGVDLRYLKLTKLPVKFGTVSGDFYCNSNKLTTLEGSPNHVGGDFYCADNKLTTLEGAPNHVGGNLDCTYNQLTTLEGAPHHVGYDFNCEYNRLTTLEGAPRHVGRGFYCEYNPIYSIWVLIWNKDVIDLLNDYDCLRGTDIIIDRFNEFLQEIGKPPVESVEGYNNILQ